MVLARVVQQFARHGEFVPKEGGTLQISLPGEIVGALVLQVHGRDVVVVELAVYFDRQGVKKQSAILGKSGHSYKPGDIVTCQRGTEPHLGVEIWAPVDERKLHEMQNAERLAAELSRKPAPEPAEVPEAAAPESGSGPAAEPETEPPKKVLGPRRTKIARPVPEPVPYRRVLGPRRSKTSRPQEAAK